MTSIEKKCPNCGIKLMLVEVAVDSEFIPKSVIRKRIKEREGGFKIANDTINKFTEKELLAWIITELKDLLGEKK